MTFHNPAMGYPYFCAFFYPVVTILLRRHNFLSLVFTWFISILTLWRRWVNFLPELQPDKVTLFVSPPRSSIYLFVHFKAAKMSSSSQFPIFFRLFLLLGVLKIRKPPVGKTETQQAHFGLRQIFVTVPDKGTQNKWKLLKNSHSNSYVVGRDSWNYPGKMLACFIISNLDSDGVKMMLKFKSFWPLTWLVPWLNPPTNFRLYYDFSRKITEMLI